VAVRIYQDVPLFVGCSFSLSKLARDHLVKVLRFKADDCFIVFNGDGQCFEASLVMESGRYSGQVHKVFPGSPELSFGCHLGQCVIKGERMDFAIKKAVELGVASVTPLISERALRLSAERLEKKMSHWRKVIISACEQCGRNCLPDLHSPQLVSDWLVCRKESLKVFLDPVGDVKLRHLGVAQDVAVAVGPEGGWSDMELQVARRFEWTSVQLGPAVLRSETVGLAVLAGLQALWG